MSILVLLKKAHVAETFNSNFNFDVMNKAKHINVCVYTVIALFCLLNELTVAKVMTTLATKAHKDKYPQMFN